jgi:hypothetical protein
VKWIDLTEGRKKWLAVVNVVMNIRAPHSPGDLLYQELQVVAVESKVLISSRSFEASHELSNTVVFDSS